MFSSPRARSRLSAQQCQCGRDDTLEQGPLRAHTREDTNPHQHAEEVLRKGFRRKGPPDRAGGLAGPDAFQEKCLDADKNFGNELAKGRIMRPTASTAFTSIHPFRSR